jgi:hypothetical protein
MAKNKTKIYKLVRLDGDQVITGKELYDWLIADGFPIMDVHVMDVHQRPPKPTKPLMGAPREQWLEYALAMQKWDVDCAVVNKHNDDQLKLRGDDIEAFATYLAMKFQIASYEVIGKTNQGEKIRGWAINTDGKYTYKQNAQRVLDVINEDSFSPYYEIAWGTSNGIMR